MSTKRTALYGLALAAALVLTVSVAQARNWGGPGGGYGGCPGWNNAQGYQAQQLTPEKQAAVDKILDAHRQKMLKLREDLNAKTYELEALSNSGKGSEKTFRELSQSIAQLRTQMATERDSLRTALEQETGIKAGYGRGQGYCGYAACGGQNYGKNGGRGYHRGNW